MTASHAWEGHDGTLPKRGTPPPYVRPCPPGGPHIGGGRFVPPNSVHELSEISVSGEDLRLVEREDVVASLQLLLEEGPYRRDCGVPNKQ